MSHTLEILGIVLALASLGLWWFQVGQRTLLAKAGQKHIDVQVTITPLNNTNMNAPKQYIPFTEDRAVMRAVMNLVKGDPHKAVKLAAEAFKTEPKRWNELRKELALVPLDRLPALDVALAAEDRACKEKGDELTSQCAKLIWRICSLNPVFSGSPLSIDSARAWCEAGNEYHELALFALRSETACREMALSCYLHALEIHRANNATLQQIEMLYNIGKILFHKANSAIDEAASCFSAIDTYEQARALLRLGNSAIHPQFIYNIFSNLGSLYRSLAQMLHNVRYLQQALGVYQELQRYSSPGPAEEFDIRQIIFDIERELQQTDAYH